MENWGLFNKTTEFYSSTLSIKGREWWGENGRVSWRGWMVPYIIKKKMFEITDIACYVKQYFMYKVL